MLAVKTHLTWLCVAVVALIIGTVSAKKEVRIIEKPAEVGRTKEAGGEKPAETKPAAAVASESPAEAKPGLPLEIPQNYLLAELFFQSYSSARPFEKDEILRGLVAVNPAVSVSEELKPFLSTTELARVIEERLKQNGVPILDNGKTLLFDFSGVWNEASGAFDYSATVSLVEGVNVLRPGGFRAATLPVWHFTYPGSARKTNVGEETMVAAERLVASFSRAFLATNPK